MFGSIFPILRHRPLLDRLLLQESQLLNFSSSLDIYHIQCHHHYVILSSLCIIYLHYAARSCIFYLLVRSKFRKINWKCASTCDLKVYLALKVIYYLNISVKFKTIINTTVGITRI